jgi:hypothetical protein
MMLTLEKIQYVHRPLAYYAILTSLQVHTCIDVYIFLHILCTIVCVCVCPYIYVCVCRGVHVCLWAYYAILTGLQVRLPLCLRLLRWLVDESDSIYVCNDMCWVSAYVCMCGGGWSDRLWGMCVVVKIKSARVNE